MTIIGTQSWVADHQIVLAFENHLLGTAGTTVTASSTASPGNLVPANLLTPWLDEAWRSGSLAALVAAGRQTVTLRFTLAAARSVNWLSLHRSNLQIPFRLRLYRGTLAVPGEVLFESAWTDPVVRSRTSDYPTFSSMPWTLGPAQRVINDAAATFRLHSIVEADQTYTNVRLVEVEFDISSGANGAADYIQLALPIACRHFRPRVNMKLGWSLSLVDRSETHRAESGALLGRQRSRGRSLSFTLHAVDYDEAFGRIFEDWMRQHGTLGRIFVWPDPHHREHFHTNAFVGTATALPAIEMANLEWPAANGWQIEETE